MELIRRTESRRNKTGKLRYYGMFKCPYCKEEVEKVVDSGKKSKSCGCYTNKLISEKKIIHGDRVGKKLGIKNRLYDIWRGMRRRCHNENEQNYHRYGGRGIVVCREWIYYSKFKDWAMNNGYDDNLEIDRIDNDKNYYPNNCRWVTHRENSRNRNNVKLKYDDVIKIKILLKNKNFTHKQIADIFNVKKSCIADISRNRTWKEIYI